MFKKGEPRKISFPALNSTRSDCAPLKTLTVIDGLRWFERAVLERHRFSELTNLELFACAAHPTAIIGFIAEHPNLHAVSLDPIELSVPLALIVAASAFRRRELRLDLTTLQWEGPPLNLAPASTRLAVFNFANVDNLSFTRRGPLSAAVHDHDHGLQSLSLSFSALLNLSQLMALGAIPTILPQCGELNLKLLGTTLQTTEALLDRLGQSLSKWNHLTTLKLACILPDDWETSLELPLPVDHHGRPFPPTENSPTPMDTWYAATVQSAARYVRALAAQVTGLAVFEWSLRPDSFTRSSWGPLQPPLWRWDIIRDPDGSIRLLNEHLTWDGQINHPPYSRYH
ncbi:hypothetical protein MIND_00462200 [Mycena indigotica]|uniref:Uncharacterized protein n=1 Tax=Mycena indigotica TaxID=2126181 RepID=A0A8H6SX17_9AGAR|nr:uncharacterized protein MIND_00462200 [Mycena indigotica]KAF7306705.1 hypothetical protein MIND_00462200 [Mycena indigotica]